MRLNPPLGESLAASSVRSLSSQPSTRRKDHLYVLEHGRIYTSASIDITNRTRVYASINLALDDTPFFLRVGEHAGCAHVAIVGPGPQRMMRAQGVRVVCVQLDPTHPLFRRFRGATRAGLMRLERGAFAHLDRRLDATFRGTLDVERVAELHDEVTAIAAGYLPRPKPIDSRIRRILDTLNEHPMPPLAQLSEAVGLSYYRMSHLFAESMGVSLRSYCLWQKLCRFRAAFENRKSLTEIAQEAGFSDSAHLTRTYQQMYGAAPSYFLRSKSVRVRTSARVRNCGEG